MKHPRRKLIVSVLVMSALLVALTFGFARVHFLANAKDFDRETALKMHGLLMTIDSLIETQDRVTKDYVTQLTQSLDLITLPLRDIVDTQGDGAIRRYENGLVLRRDGDELVLPEDVSGLPLLEAQTREGDAPLALSPCRPFEDKYGLFWSHMSDDPDGEYVLCAYLQFSDPYYYVYYTPESSITDYIDSRVDPLAVMSGAEAAYDGYILAGVEEDGDLALFYCSSALGDYTRASQLGIAIRSSARVLMEPLFVDGEKYYYSISAPTRLRMKDQDLRVVYIVPDSDYYSRSVMKIELLSLVSGVAFIAILALALSAIFLVRREIITASQRRRYGAGRMRMAATVIGVIGLVCVLAVSVFSDALSNLYFTTKANQSALETLERMMAENRDHTQGVTRQRDEQYLHYCNRVAELLYDYPELKSAGQFSAMCETIGADYLMLFDDRGNELLSNARFVGLSYGKDPESSTYDFRRLISGVPSIVHEPCVDEVTGLDRQLIGVSLDDGDRTNGYSSLIMAIEPNGDDSMISTREIMRSLTTDDSVVFAVDEENGLVVEASDDALIGKRAVDIGLTDGSLRDGFMDFCVLNNGRWYACSRASDGAIYYYAVRTNLLFENLLRGGLLNAALFAAFYLVLALVLLFGYTEKAVDDFGGRVVDDQTWLTQRVSRLRIRRFGNATDRIRAWWRRKTPEGKAWFAMQSLMGVSLIGLLLSLRSEGQQGVVAVIAYVLNGQWTFGYNLFALTRIVILLLMMTLTLLTLKLLIGLLGGALDTKGETVCHLVESLLRYVVIITGAFFIFQSLGFDTPTLLASLGIFSLAISLASKDLVADVLSGVIIVFSGEYQIGEIVEIAGFRGRVAEIGVRSTTLVSKEGNVKYMSNRNVSDVINLSRLNTHCMIQIGVASGQSLEKIEALIERELPGIGERVSGIVGDPVYRGVTGLSGGSLLLSFSAECSEEDYVSVRRDLNSQIIRLLEENDVSLR